MRAALLELKIPMGMYREPGSRFYSPRSMVVPPVSALLGMLLAITGVGGADWGVDSRIRDGFVCDNLQGLRFGIKVMKMPQTTTLGVKDFLASRLPWQPIIGGEYRILVDASDAGDVASGWLLDAVQRIETKDFVFAPYAGMSSFPVVLEVYDKDVKVEPVCEEEEVEVASGVFLKNGLVLTDCGTFVLKPSAGLVVSGMHMVILGYGPNVRPVEFLNFAAGEQPLTLLKRSDDTGDMKLVRVGDELWLLTPPLRCNG